AGLEREREPCRLGVAALAHRLRLLDLGDRRSSIPDREEQLGIMLEALGMVAPVHRLSLFPERPATPVRRSAARLVPDGTVSDLQLHNTDRKSTRLNSSHVS